MEEFLPLVLVHKIHRNIQSSQVEIVPLTYYWKEPEPEPEPEIEIELPPPPEPCIPYVPKPKKLHDTENWWDSSQPVYAFNNPRLRSRLEKLMGSNVVRITDRKYMLLLQERIKEDHLENQRKRIQEREAEEVEREKKLILEGKIPIEEAPSELKDHPVCRITQITKKILEDKRAKMKPPSRTTAYKTSAKRIAEAEKAEREASPTRNEEDAEDVGQAASVLGLNEDANDGIARGFMFSKEDYDKLKYEAPLVKLLKEVENVEEMYKLADEIVGPLKTGGCSK